MLWKEEEAHNVGNDCFSAGGLLTSSPAAQRGKETADGFWWFAVSYNVRGSRLVVHKRPLNRLRFLGNLISMGCV